VSDRSEGPGWWLASDGQWYAPETHPSFHADTAPRPVPMTTEPETTEGQAPAEEARLVGPQFPDLFQKAMEGSHLVDNVVVHNLGEGASYPLGPPSLGSAVTGRPVTTNSTTTTAATWTSTPTSTKRRWRRGH
jgi:hypothetical protein